MQPLNDLTYRGQALRLKRLALIALKHYPLKLKKLELIHHGENTTFRLTACQGNRESQHLVRVHRAGYQTPDSIRSELLWLEALARDTDIPAPRPNRNVDGDPLTVATAPGIPEPRCVVVFDWIPGRFLERSLGPASFSRVGQLTARLHDHASRWKPPAGFVRQVWDADGLLGPQPIMGSLFSHSRMKKAHRETIMAGTLQIQEILRGMGKGRDVFGLIHADLHHGNYLFSGRDVHPIDFDDSGFGYFLYDLAVTLLAVNRRQDYERLRQALIQGYRSVRPIPDDHVRIVDLFIQTRRLVMSGWLMSRSDNPRFRARLHGLIPRTARDLSRFLERSTWTNSHDRVDGAVVQAGD